MEKLQCSLLALHIRYDQPFITRKINRPNIQTDIPYKVRSTITRTVDMILQAQHGMYCKERETTTRT